MDTTQKMPSAVRLNLELASKADVLAAELAARKTDLDPQIAALKEQMAPLAATLAALEAAHVKAHDAEQDALANAAMHRRMVASEGWQTAESPPAPPAPQPPAMTAAGNLHALVGHRVTVTYLDGATLTGNLTAVDHVALTLDDANGFGDETFRPGLDNVLSVVPAQDQGAGVSV